jgi:hypothetical protein
MSSSPRMAAADEKPRRSFVRRVLGCLAAAFAVVVFLVAIAVLNNNYSLHQPSRAEFNARLDHAIDTATQWIVQNPDNYGNPPLMFMVGDMAEMSGDPRLQKYVQDYLVSPRVHIPGSPASWYWSHWAYPPAPIPLIPRYQIPYLTWQDRWFSYASAPDKVDITEADRADLFSPTKYHWGTRLHLQFVALDIYRHFNGPSPKLNAVINPIAEDVAREAYWDFRVNDAYYQRNALILGAGRPDLIRSRWIQRILDSQFPDGTWNYCWHGWCRGLLEFKWQEPTDRGHSTVQAAWALYQLKYRYSEWINKNYH